MAIIALAGGGTGGHVYPALAIGDALRARGHEVVYYGDGARLEARVAPSRGYRFRPVRALQYPRGGVVGKVRFAFALAAGVASARRMLVEDRVDLVLGVGGYISAAPVLAAWSLGRRSAIHEANAVLGLANRLCARVADVVLLTFERTRASVPPRVTPEVVGVPVNPGVLAGDRQQAAARYGLDPSLPVAVFVGGSLGAARLNELALAAARAPRAFSVLHLCGPRYHDEVLAQLGAAPPNYVLVAYEDRMADAYAVADLIVCRAGSATLAEVAACGVPSVLIPSPNVTENHQEENARGLEALGAAEVVVERGWSVDGALQVITRLMGDPARRAEMARAARGAARLDAASRAADLIEGALARST